MLRVTKRKLSIFAGALAAALGLTVVTAGSAFAWDDRATLVDGTCDQLEAKGFFEKKHGGPLDDEGKPTDVVDFRIYSDGSNEPSRTGTFVFENLDDTEATDEERGTGHGSIEPLLPPGAYEIRWDVRFQTGDEHGSSDLVIPEECKGVAVPVVDVVLNCEENGISVFLDNTEGTADAVFTISIDGEALEPDTVPAGEGLEAVIELEDGDYNVVVTESTTKFEKSFQIAVDCVDDDTTPPADEETPPDQGSTLPKTGAGFPTGAAAAFALFLLSIGGFLLTYRKGMLPIPSRRRH